LGAFAVRRGGGTDRSAGFPLPTMLRAVQPGFWSDLSDVKLSAQLARDLLFRKFRRVAPTPGNHAEVRAKLRADAAYIGAFLARHNMADRVQRRGGAAIP